MTDTKNIQTTEIHGITAKQWDLIGAITPPDKIKTRPGRGGKQFRYVEASYIVELLNTTFNGLWDFEILSEQIGKSQVWVKGKLTVHLTPELSISKTQYGGSDIKKLQNSDTSIDLADDLKAAGQDALKKCASLMGFAADIYGKLPETSGSEDESPRNPQQVVYGKITPAQIKLMHVLLSKSTEINKDELKEKYGVEHTEDLTKEQASEIIDMLKKEVEGVNY